MNSLFLYLIQKPRFEKNPNMYNSLYLIHRKSQKLEIFKLKSRKNHFFSLIFLIFFSFQLSTSISFFCEVTFNNYQPSLRKIRIKIYSKYFKISQIFFSFQVNFFPFFFNLKFRETISQQLEVVKKSSIDQKKAQQKFFLPVCRTLLIYFWNFNIFAFLPRNPQNCIFFYT